MWEEWRITVWQRSLQIVVHRECVAEAGRRNDGKKVSSKTPPALLLEEQALAYRKDEEEEFAQNFPANFPNTEDQEISFS
jgi:hypothetical protein